MKKFIKSLKFIFKPSWWYMEYSYCKELDLFINELLDRCEFCNISAHTATLGGVMFWTSNQPYSCFNTYGELAFGSSRPSRLTIERAIKRLQQDSIKQFKTRESRNT